jgi:hypothetical protein
VTGRFLMGRRPALAVSVLLFSLPLAAVAGCRSASSEGETKAAAAGTPAAAGPTTAAQGGGPMAMPMRNNMHRRPARPD